MAAEEKLMKLFMCLVLTGSLGKSGKKRQNNSLQCLKNRICSSAGWNFINIGIYITIYMTLEFHQQPVLMFDIYTAMVLAHLFDRGCSWFCLCL